MKKGFLEDWERSFLKIDKTMVCGYRWSYEGLVSTFLNTEKQIYGWKTNYHLSVSKKEKMKSCLKIK